MHLVNVNHEKTTCTTAKLENGVVISVFNSNIVNYIKEIKFKRYHGHRRKKYCFLCKSKTNSLMLILGFYVIIFSAASVLLIVSVLRLQNVTEIGRNNYTSLKSGERNYSTRSNLKLKQISGLFSERLFKEFNWPFKISIFNCSNLSRIKKFKYLTSGWTKNVFSFEHMGKSYALKSVNVNGEDMKNCMEKETMKICFEKASLKMYKEYILSKELFHTNIIKVLAWCVSNSGFFNEVAIITRLCTPIDMVSLLRLSFSQRLKVMLDLSELMVYLANSPLGSIAINDFQRQQFVLCGNTLKLTDLDDLSIEEPKCNNTLQCNKKKLLQYLKPNENHTTNLKCIRNSCLGYNEKQNVINAYIHFVNLFLNITVPDSLRKNVEYVFDSYTSTWDAKSVLVATKDLYFEYQKLINSKIM